MVKNKINRNKANKKRNKFKKTFNRYIKKKVNGKTIKIDKVNFKGEREIELQHDMNTAELWYLRSLFHPFKTEGVKIPSPYDIGSSTGSWKGSFFVDDVGKNCAVALYPYTENPLRLVKNIDSDASTFNFSSYYSESTPETNPFTSGSNTMAVRVVSAGLIVREAGKLEDRSATFYGGQMIGPYFTSTLTKDDIVDSYMSRTNSPEEMTEMCETYIPLDTSTTRFEYNYVGNTRNLKFPVIYMSGSTSKRIEIRYIINYEYFPTTSIAKMNKFEPPAHGFVDKAWSFIKHIFNKASKEYKHIQHVANIAKKLSYLVMGDCAYEILKEEAKMKGHSNKEPAIEENSLNNDSNTSNSNIENLIIDDIDECVCEDFDESLYNVPVGMDDANKNDVDEKSNDESPSEDKTSNEEKSIENNSESLVNESCCFDLTIKFTKLSERISKAFLILYGIDLNSEIFNNNENLDEDQ